MSDISPGFIIDKSNINLLTRKYIEEAIKEDTEEAAKFLNITFKEALEARIGLIQKGISVMAASRAPRKEEMQ